MFMGLPNFCFRFRKDMILSDGVVFVASRTRFGSVHAGRAGKGAPHAYTKDIFKSYHTYTKSPYESRETTMAIKLYHRI